MSASHAENSGFESPWGRQRKHNNNMSLFGLGKALFGAVLKPVARVAKASVQMVTMDDRAVESLEKVVTGTGDDLKKIKEETEDTLKTDD